MKMLPHPYQPSGTIDLRWQLMTYGTGFLYPHCYSTMWNTIQFCNWITKLYHRLTTCSQLWKLTISRWGPGQKHWNHACDLWSWVYTDKAGIKHTSFNCKIHNMNLIFWQDVSGLSLLMASTWDVRVAVFMTVIIHWTPYMITFVSNTRVSVINVQWHAAQQLWNRVSRLVPCTSTGSLSCMTTKGVKSCFSWSLSLSAWKFCKPMIP